MTRALVIFVLPAAVLLSFVGCRKAEPIVGSAPTTTDAVAFGPNDWPWWRGPNRDGSAAADENPPLTWSETKNIVWKTRIPGHSHGAATVVGQRVFLAIAEPEIQSQSVLCLDRTTGKPLWQTELHRGAIDTSDTHGKSSHASCTPACDGSRIFVNLVHDGSVYASALAVTGEKLWQTKITDYVNYQGFGASPAVYGPLVIVLADTKATGAVVALDRATGNLVWKQPRPRKPNYTSPIILKADGRDQLFVTGCDLVSSFDPMTGTKLWETSGATTECVTSTVTDGKAIFTSGGYPKSHLAAVAADGSGKVLWEKKPGLYVPSPVIKDGYLYGVMDNGVAMCWNSATGEELWKGRLSGGDVSASPVLVGDKVYVMNEHGTTFVFRATPKKFELLEKNQLGDLELIATPTFCGDRIYIRAATMTDGRRQETLYCLGKK